MVISIRKWLYEGTRRLCLRLRYSKTTSSACCSRFQVRLHLSSIQLADLHILPGIKCLILDSETTPIISLVLSQSKILKKDVYLIERLEQPSEGKMAHLKALYLIRPTEENMRAV